MLVAVGLFSGFELFVRPMGSPAYCAINMAPSGAWATYLFDSYRQGMRVSRLAPDVEPFRLRDDSLFEMVMTFAWPDAPELDPGRGIAIGCSAIVVEANGTKSYWAIAHPP